MGRALHLRKTPLLALAGACSLVSAVLPGDALAQGSACVLARWGYRSHFCPVDGRAAEL